jgi:RNA polymerase sigma factor (sigma-70 family)
MTTANLDTVLRLVRKLVDDREARDLTDGELLERFRKGREEAAFAILVQRHGPRVLGVCRHVLGNAHDAEDAFQATFLVLARNAGAIRRGASVANWLHGVARRVAHKARARAERRRAHERRAPPMSNPDPGDPLTWQELCSAIDEETARLPEAYRAALVLCSMEGKTQEEAARQLGCPKSTLGSRLERARHLLREALARRGLELSSGALAAVLAERSASAAVPALLLLATVRAAGRALAAGGVTANVLALAEGAAPAAAGARWKIMAAVLLAGALLTGAALGAAALAEGEPGLAPEAGGSGAVAANAPNPAPQQAPQAAQPPAKPVVPDLDKLLQEVIDGKIERRMLCVEIACGGKTADEQGFVRIYGNGAGIWDPHSGKRGVATGFGKPFTLPEAEVTELLGRLKTARLGPMHRNLDLLAGPRKVAWGPRAQNLPSGVGVSLLIRNRQHDVGYTVPAGRSIYKPEADRGAEGQRMAELVRAVRAIAVKAAAKSRAVTGLADGLQKIVRKELAPEHLQLHIHRDRMVPQDKPEKPAPNIDRIAGAGKLLDGWRLTVQGPFVRAHRYPWHFTEPPPTVEATLILSRDEVVELAKLLLDADLANLPRSLVPNQKPAKGEYFVSRMNATVVRPVLEFTVGKQLIGKDLQVPPSRLKAWERMIERLDQLSQRVVQQGEPFWR